MDNFPKFCRSDCIIPRFSMVKLSKFQGSLQPPCSQQSDQSAVQISKVLLLSVLRKYFKIKITQTDIYKDYRKNN